jgi:hypothetical protein
VRSAFKAGAQIWATGLTAIQRAAWNAFAAVHPFVNVFGDSITLSGISMFQSLNQRLQLVGEAVLLSPPSSFVVADLGSVSVGLSIGAGIFTALTMVPARPLVYSEGLYVMMTPGLPMGVKIQKTDFRLINTPVSGLFAANEALADFANARFSGAPWPSGKQYSFRILCMNAATGAISSPIVVPGLVG